MPLGGGPAIPARDARPPAAPAPRRRAPRGTPWLCARAPRAGLHGDKSTGRPMLLMSTELFSGVVLPLGPRGSRRGAGALGQGTSCVTAGSSASERTAVRARWLRRRSSCAVPARHSRRDHRT